MTAKECIINDTKKSPLASPFSSQTSPFHVPIDSFGKFADHSDECAVFFLKPHVVGFQIFQHLQLLQSLGQSALQMLVLEPVHILEGVVVEGGRRGGRRRG